MSDYMKEAERLLAEHEQAAGLCRYADCQTTRSALLAHIQRGAPAPAEVPMPDPYCHLTTGSVEWMRNSPETRTVSATASGKPNENTRPVFLVEQMQLYGDDREAAGYARGLRELLDCRTCRNYTRDGCIQTAQCADGDGYRRATPIRFWSAALRGEVKP